MASTLASCGSEPPWKPEAARPWLSLADVFIVTSHETLSLNHPVKLPQNS